MRSAADIWKSLFAVLLALGFDHNSQEWKDLSSFAKEMHRDPEIAEIERQIAVIATLKNLASEGNIQGITTKLVEHLTNEGIKIDNSEFLSLMKDWGFEQKNIRLDGEPRRAWEILLCKLLQLELDLTKHLYTPKTVTTVTTPEQEGE